MTEQKYSLADILFLPDKMNKQFQKDCIEFIEWVDSELPIEENDTYAMDAKFADNAREKIKELKSVSKFLQKMHEDIE
jgi:hypothetical protein